MGRLGALVPKGECGLSEWFLLCRKVEPISSGEYTTQENIPMMAKGWLPWEALQNQLPYWAMRFLPPLTTALLAEFR